MALATGTRLGPYEIAGQIAASGTADVYKATDTRLNRTVSVKVLPPHFSNNPDSRQRLEREARMIASLSHPHICTLHDIGNADGHDFLVIEHVEGETLADRLKRGAMTLEEALKLAVEMADALDKAHAQGVSHRELKPANIMLTASGVKLMDFGLAEWTMPQAALAVNSTAPTATGPAAPGAVMGTVEYMTNFQLGWVSRTGGVIAGAGDVMTAGDFDA